MRSQGARRLTAAALVAALTGAALAALAAEPEQLKGPTPMTETTPAPPLPTPVEDDRRVARNYPDQPPVIPHSIRDYEINLNVNECLGCHSRQYTAGSQAPMISVTHFQDRDGQTLATVSPRRYNCTGCHVPQTQAQPLVENRFVDVDTLIGRARQ
jgi:cytochrome c-type protein NapB